MAFISTQSPTDATGLLNEMYERMQGKYGYVPNYAKTFSHRPEVMNLWSDLLYGIRKNMDKRRFELVTLAAATSIRSTLCSLAHGHALTRFFTADEVLAIATASDTPFLSAGEQAMLRFARKISRAAATVTADEVDELRAAEFSDAEIFDIAAVATARSFFAQLIEGLGTPNDHAYPMLDKRLRDALTVGRPLECAAATSAWASQATAR
jgi:uncharacterized peroxidase-related enzyme